ncbi:hypothetical protein GGI11_000425 [Coemansia sp. RSA 2049]|nr:hypothetical protein GGI11_000425 [Coemansia sp. RSA 2049]
MYTSQQASYKALPSSTRSRRVSGNHSSSRPSLQQALYRASPSTHANTTPVAPPAVATTVSKTKSAAAASESASGASGASGGITLQSWARSQYQMAQQVSAQRPGSVVFQAPSYHYLPQTGGGSGGFGAAPMAMPRPQSSAGGLGGLDGRSVQFAVADYFDPYRSNSRGQTVDVDAAEVSAAARVNSSPLRHHQQQQQQAKLDHHHATPPSPVMRATRHSRPSTPTSPTSPTSPTGAAAFRAQQQQQQRHQHIHAGNQLPPSAHSSADSLRSAANNVSPAANRTVQKEYHHHSAYSSSPQAVRNVRTTGAPAPLYNAPLHSLAEPRAISAAAASRAKPRSYSGTDGLDGLAISGVGGTNDWVHSVPSRPRVSSMYATTTTSDHVVGESRARKAESPTKLDLGSAATSSSAGDLTAMQRPIARPRIFKQQQQQQQPQPQPKLHHPGERIVGPAGNINTSGSLETKKSNLIEFIEQQRQQHQAKLTATQKASVPPPQPRIAAQVPVSASRPEPPAKLTSRSDSTGSMRSDSSERSFKRSTARLAEVDPAAARKPAAPQQLPTVAAAPTLEVADISSNSGAVASRAPKYSSWYGNIQPRANIEPGEHVAPEKPNHDHLNGLPISTRLQPRARAYSHTSPEPSDAPGIGGIRTRNSNDSLGSCSYSRAPKTVLERIPAKGNLHSNTPAAVAGTRGSALPNPYSRNPQHLSVAVQTDRASVKTVSQGVQTNSSATIHGDDAVLDLMRQMDTLRSTHAVQISEYQEHVIDLELTNRDQATEIEQVTERLVSREKEHSHVVDELRGRLAASTKRVDREIGEVKAMHAAKCDELTAQVSLLLNRCQRYRQRLLDAGVSEDELLQLATTESDDTSLQQNDDGSLASSDQLQIADLAFIEKQYIETRESSQEADYFKQLMEIESSMENTTMALGFELKRTQAKYLQQAADFVREQMARLQVESTRSESRLSARSPAASAIIGGGGGTIGATFSRSLNRGLSESSGSEAAGTKAPVHERPPLPQLPSAAPALVSETIGGDSLQSGGTLRADDIQHQESHVEADTMRPPHRRIAGPEPSNVLSNTRRSRTFGNNSSSNNVNDEDDDYYYADETVDVILSVSRKDLEAASTAAAEHVGKTGGSNSLADASLRVDQLPSVSKQRSSSMATYSEQQQQPRWATVSNALGIRRRNHAGSLAIDGSNNSNSYFPTAADISGGSIAARGFHSESRTSGLSRMINAAAGRSGGSGSFRDTRAQPDQRLAAGLNSRREPAAMTLGSDVDGSVNASGTFMTSTSASSYNNSYSNSSSQSSHCDTGNSSPRRHPHRSPLSNIASGFFTASIDSLATSTATIATEMLAPQSASTTGSGVGLLEELHDTHSHSSQQQQQQQRQRQLNASSGTLVGSMVKAKTSSTLADGTGVRPMSMVVGAASKNGGGGSLGYFSGHRKTHETSPSSFGFGSIDNIVGGGSRLKSHGSGDDVLGSSFGSFRSSSGFWPPQSGSASASASLRADYKQRSSRSNSVVDSQDMTTEELLESLKLPMPQSGGGGGGGGIGGASSRPGSSSYGTLPSPGGSLGRHSPLPRTSSFSDMSRTLPFAASSAAISESPPSDSTLPPAAAFGTGFSRVSVSTFDPHAEFNINLGLDSSAAPGERKIAAAASASSLGRSANQMAAARRANNAGRTTGSSSSSSTGRRLGNRRRSRSVCVWERR